MAPVPSFDEYIASLGRLTAHIDPTASTPEAEEIKAATRTLEMMGDVTKERLSGWVERNPTRVPVLGLVVGLSQERLKNVLRNHFDTSGWMTLAQRRPSDLIEWFDNEFDLIRMLVIQREKQYSLEDVLVARAGSRVIATQAGRSGRKIEDEIEAIAIDLGLPYDTRTRFEGRNGQTAPADLVIPGAGNSQIAVAAKGFDSTGSKLTDAVREIQEMAAIRRPNQYVMAVIDGIGWKSRVSDLKRIHGLWVSGDLDGMYTLATLDVFRDDLKEAALRLRLMG
ncbi:MAG: hypothetical protein K0S37_4100 [Microbacterium sp.]|jgi:hypothetical protein|nr:hypothetical protein [Microbacterium sp.]